MATGGVNNSATLTSEVINYLIYRYLQESGFTHTAFTFGYESSVLRTNIDPNAVPPGSLVTFIQKGLQYLELEANVDPQDGDVEGDYKMLTPEELITNDIDALRLLVQERKDDDRQQRPPANTGQGEKRKEKEKEKDKDRDKEREKEKRKEEADKVEKKEEDAKPAKDGKQAKQEQRTALAAPAPTPAPAPAPAPAPTPMEEDTPALEVPLSSVLTLHGHDSEVYICAWSPAEQLLASGSGDSTARIWNINPSSQDYARSVVLHHEVKADKSKDVTTLDWNQDGTLLATGSYDGLARIWSKDGKLKQTLDKHQGPIFALKWNKKGDHLLSGSVDKTAIVWDAKTGEAKQVFDFHSAPTLDVDWRNNASFATCSTDKLIHVCKLGDTKPLKTFAGHEDEVNAIKWDPSGRFLASCSDDRTAKVWSLSHDKCVHDFKDHDREIYTIKWSPTGTGTANPNLPLLLASASFDHTVRLWDIEQGKCVHCLEKHVEPVYSVAFSPNGRFVATGSFDRNLHVWSVEDGSLVKTFKGEAGIYEVCWNREGNKVAACFANRTVCVVDLRL